ncbi:hypothetical protein ACFVYT_30040 [Streptomyces sp. NPDC058290]|uniref:hypothetical protein n=1 Tax=unclassified Streptomyces TaxID=2593676 RepID=UPI0036E44D2D
MNPALRVIVYPLVTKGGRRVRCDGEILGAWAWVFARSERSAGDVSVTRGLYNVVPATARR